MSKIGYQPVFPEIDGANGGYVPGMTYRQWLVGMALQGLLANSNPHEWRHDLTSSTAIDFVDALLVQLEKRP